jgi:Ser/Thr protein kinase RdoA (MazF antagonist)
VTDAALVGRLLDEYHERSVPPADIHLAAGSEHESRATYVLTLPDGSGQVIRAFRADALVPVHGRDSRNLTVADWLIGRAHTLAWLEAAAYPAPRPVRTRTGELVGVAGPWLTWATSYVAGDLLLPTLSQLRSLGVTLGRLHAVAPWPALPSGRSGKADLASQHPAVAGQAAMARLDAVDGLVPAAWRPLYAACRETAETVLGASRAWAETVVHGDVWARNAVQADGGPVTLIDWETGGLGLAVIDLGSCLLECHLDAAVPDHESDAWLISPDEDRIREVTAGYASVRRLSTAELSLLPAAVKFAAAVVGSVHFELALLSGVSGPAMDARLSRLENRMAVADEVGELALEHLGPLCGGLKELADRLVGSHGIEPWTFRV